MKQRSGRAPPARSPPAPGPRHSVPSGSGLKRSASRRRSFFQNGTVPGQLCSARVSGARRAPGKGRGAGGMRRCASPLRNHPRVVVFQTTASPSPLQLSPEERGSPYIWEHCTIKPLPRSYISNFFVFRSFISYTCSTPRFPLLCSLSRGLEGLISQLDFNYPFEDADAEPRAARLSPPVSSRQCHRAEPSICRKRIEHPHVPVPPLPALEGLAT